MCFFRRFLFLFSKKLKVIIFTISCISIVPVNAAIIPFSYVFLSDTPTSAIAVLQGGFEAHLIPAPQKFLTDFSISITGTNWETSIFFRRDLFSLEREDEPGKFDEELTWSVSQILGRHIINPHGEGEAVSAPQLQIGFDISPGDEFDFADYAFEDIQGLNPDTPIYIGFGKDSLNHPALAGPHMDRMTASLADLDGGSQRFLGPTISSGGEISLTVRLTHMVDEPHSLSLFFIGLLFIGITSHQRKSEVG